MKDLPPRLPTTSQHSWTCWRGGVSRPVSCLNNGRSSSVMASPKIDRRTTCHAFHVNNCLNSGRNNRGSWIASRIVTVQPPSRPGQRTLRQGSERRSLVLSSISFLSYFLCEKGRPCCCCSSSP